MLQICKENSGRSAQDLENFWYFGGASDYFLCYFEQYKFAMYRHADPTCPSVNSVPPVPH